MNSKSNADLRSTTPGVSGVKTLVRNCRSAPAVPVKNCQPVRSESAENKRVRGTDNKVTEGSREEVILSEPQLLTTMKMREKLKNMNVNLKKMNVGVKSVRFEQKAPPDCQSKVSKKVNIKFDEKIYRDLIDLKVTEDDLSLRPIASGKTKEMNRVREPVPELTDFYRPKFDKEYVVKPHPPCWPITKIPARPPGAASSVLRAVKKWSIDDNRLF